MTHFLLVHGAWHGARHWESLRAELVERGHVVAAIDLPGHGDHVEAPAGYAERDRAAFVAARSPVAGVTLDVAARGVVAELDTHFLEHNKRKPVVVAHSMGGAVVTRAAELASDLIDQLVYVAAFVPTQLGAAGAYLGLPEAQSALGDGLYLGDSSVTGAVRIDPLTDDTDYLDELHRAYFTDVDDASFAAVVPTLTPDQPVSFLVQATGATADRWGSLRRAYVRTSGDRALPPALQDVMIRHGDELAPDTAFRVATVEAGHAPFLSRPSELADILETLTFN